MKKIKTKDTALYKYDLKPVVHINENREHRCSYCGVLLFKGVMGKGTQIEVKCSRPKCRRLVKFMVI